MSVERTDHGMTLEEIRAIQDRYGKGPHLAADLVVLSACWQASGPELRVLLIQRGNKPFRGAWALPGGFVDMDEDLETAARRELQEETGIPDLGAARVEQLGAFGHPLRDPRSRVVSIVHLAWVPWRTLPAPKAGDDAAAAQFVSLRDGVATDEEGTPLALAFDHELVLALAWERIGTLTSFSSAPLSLLPEIFTVDQLGALYRGLIGPIDVAILRDGLERNGWIQAVDAASWRAISTETHWNSPPFTKPPHSM
jgi:8-oxo-dGTP diphosphatase